MDRDSILRELRVPAAVVFVVVSLLAIASYVVQGKVADASRYDRATRAAQRDRALVLRMQLNEETGIRGFTSTRDRTFLQPYTEASRLAPSAFDRLQRAVGAVDVPNGVALVRAERRTNGVWSSAVARPLLSAAETPAEAIAIQRHGKRLVDAFRAIDQRLDARIDAAAASGTDREEHALSLILVLNVVGLTALLIAALAFGILQGRFARAAFEARVLYENEKRIAESLQEAFLQKSLPYTPGVGLHATYVPASGEAQVGGDWYDAFELPDKRILFSIGDVAGHGLDAAVMMNRARQAIVTAALHEDDPAAVLGRANRSLLLQNSRMVTAICGYVDPAQRTIVYATAGHPPPVMARPGAGAEFLAHEGLPLGIVPDPQYASFRTVAEPGALMVLYTDGVLEHKRDVIAGQARLLDACTRAVGGSEPALAIEQYVFEGSRPTDDVAILAVSFARVEGGAAAPVLSALQMNRWQAGTDAVPDGAFERPRANAPGASDGARGRASTSRERRRVRPTNR